MEELLALRPPPSGCMSVCDLALVRGKLTGRAKRVDRALAKMKEDFDALHLSLLAGRPGPRNAGMTATHDHGHTPATPTPDLPGDSATLLSHDKRLQNEDVDE